jgi:hypothetical protein
MAYTTTMSTLLTAIKTRLQTYSQTGEPLASIKTWKRGVLPPIPVFPALAILPLREVHHREMSGGTYWVDRTVRLDVWQKSYQSSGRGLTDAMNLLEEVKTIVRTEEQWPVSGVAQCVNTLFGEEDVGEREPHRDVLLQRASLWVTCRSQELFPTQTVVTTVQEGGYRPFIEHVDTVIQNYKATTLSSVKSYHVHTLAPIPAMRFPAVATNGLTEALTPTHAGVDTADRRLAIHVWTYLLDKEQSLNDNLSVVEALKDILQTNYAFGGRCRNSTIDSIIYGQSATEDVHCYQSTINLTCEGVDNRPDFV